MSTEWIRQISIQPDGVYLYSKSNNDDRSFNTWKCDGLTDVYKAEGQKGLDREIVRMLNEYAQIKGHHPSVERYRSCLLAREHFSIGYVDKLNAEYAKLTSEDIATQWLPDADKTDAMKTYKRFSDAERDKYYTTLAECATPLKDTNLRERSSDAR